MKKSYATVDDVQRVVTEAVDIIVKALDNYPTKEELKLELHKTESKLEEKINQLQVDVNFIRHQTPTRSEVEEIKAKVERLSTLS